MPSNHLILLFPTPPAFNLSQDQGLFQWGSSLHQAFSISPSNEYSELISFRFDWFYLLQSKGLSRVFWTPQFKSISSLVFSFLYVPNCHIYTWLLEKTLTLTRWNFVGKVTSMLFNMLSRLVIAFLPRSKRLFIPWLQSPSAVILEPQK